MPEIVAVRFVNRLIVAAAKSVPVMSTRPIGISIVPSVTLSGTFHSRAHVALLESEHEHRERLEREAPDDAERVRLAEQVHVAAADHDGRELQHHDQIDQPVGGSEPFVRLAEPLGQHAVFRYAVQHAVRSDDGRVHGARENQEADDDDECLEYQPQRRAARRRSSPGRKSGCRRSCGRTASGMIATAKKLTSEVNSRL